MKDGDGEDLSPASFFDMAEEGPDGPAAIAARLVEECDEFVELRVGQPVILFLMRAGEKIRNGRRILGEMALPAFKGGLADLSVWLLARACGGQLPDYICTIDSLWWLTANPHQRVALVHHEIKHCGIRRDREGEPKFDDDGKPEWGILAHDIEEFQDTVIRFGDWKGNGEVAAFVEAAREGGVT